MSDIRASPRLRRAIHVIGSALFADDHGAPPPERLEFVADDFADYIEHAGFRTWLLARASLFIVLWLAPPFKGHAPLAWINLEDRVAALEAIERSVLGIFAFFLKALLCVMYYEHPDAERELVGGPLECMRVIE